MMLQNKRIKLLPFISATKGEDPCNEKIREKLRHLNDHH